MLLSFESMDTVVPFVTRIMTEDFAVTYCCFPPWEVGDFTSVSAPSSIGYSFTTQDCAVEQAGRPHDRTVPSGGTVVTGGDAPSWLRVDRPSRLIEVVAGPLLRASMADELGVSDERNLGDLLIDRDPVVRVLALRLATLAVQADLADSLCTEAMVRRLYRHVLRNRFGGRLRERSDGALDQRRLARVIDYIEAHLRTELSLTALADVAALTPYHFQRSFTRVAGCSPHQMVSLIRAFRARDLIAEGVAEPVAAKCVGFNGKRALRLALNRHGLSGNLVG
jgi:AraC family transcriptional regulator